MISYSAVNDTEIFRVKVTCSNPSDACTIANTVAQVLPDKISSVVDGSSVRVVDYAVVARTSPSYSKNMLIGFAVGVVIAVAVLVVLYLLNDTITSEEWILTTFKDDIPLLATIPDANQYGSRSTRYGSKYGYKYGYKYSKRYGYGYGYGNKTRYGGNYGGYRYSYRNGYYGSKSQLQKAPEPVEHIESL